MKVLWLANIPSPYSVDFLNELGKKCDLTVLFEREKATDRDESWTEFAFENFKGIILKGVKYSEDKAFCPGVAKILNKKYDVIVVSNMATLTGIWSVFYMRMRKINYVIQGDGGFKKSGTGIKERLKKFMISKAQKCLSTGNAHDEYYLQYGAKEENIRRIPFTSLYERDIYPCCADDFEKTEARKENEMTGDKIVLAIGQFIERKGFDLLIEAAKDFPSNVSTYIVGGECTDEYRSLIEKHNVKNIHFREFVPHDKLHSIFRAADVFVLPTREDIWGLVINEAMAHGLPIVTTNKCVSGLELVEDYVNGFIIDVNDVSAISEAVNKVLQSDLNMMGKNSIEKIKAYTFENTAKVHYEIFDDTI